MRISHKSNLDSEKSAGSEKRLNFTKIKRLCEFRLFDHEKKRNVMLSDQANDSADNDQSRNGNPLHTNNDSVKSNNKAKLSPNKVEPRRLRGKIIIRKGKSFRNIPRSVMKPHAPYVHLVQTNV